jgi:quercetin dioxygenase-like cupin family protein
VNGASRHQQGDWLQQRLKAGDFIIEAIGQWHQAVNLPNRPLKLLVIDQQAAEKSNVVMRK